MRCIRSSLLLDDSYKCTFNYSQYRSTILCLVLSTNTDMSENINIHKIEQYPINKCLVLKSQSNYKMCPIVNFSPYKISVPDQ